MSKEDREVKRLEEIIGGQHRKIEALIKLCDDALSALEVRGYGSVAYPIRQELNKLKP